MKSCTYLYFMDKFVPLDIPLDKLMEHAESKPLALFEFVRDIIEDEVGRIESVSFHEAYFDPKALDVVLEYFIRCSLGELSVKILYSDDPVRALGKYYEHEKLSAQDRGL